jgi:sterol desaturase/sphingolipid hydroxylase (fatty acid hydroxylase superfamily)
VLIGFRLIESLSHTNVRLSFGRIGATMFVGPQFHRVHHSIEHASAPFDRSRGCNFAVILPVWDVIFSTRRRDLAFPQTGVASLTGPAIDCGYLRHQWEGFRRLFAALGRLVDRRRAGFIAAFPAK